MLFRSVDSSEGPMPQTHFVLSKALEQGLNPILLINKIDKKDARIDQVVDEVYELFMDLEANDEQLDFPILYGIARQGIVVYDPEDAKDHEASVVAIVRDEQLLANPGAEFRIKAHDLVAVIGTDDARVQFSALAGHV